MTTERSLAFVSAGEALVDIVAEAGTAVARPGGSPFNVAVGLTRLGLDASFAGRLSNDTHGRMLAARLADEGVRDAFVQRGLEPTPLAVVGRAGDDAVYDFRWTGTADRGFDPTAFPDAAWERVDVLHIGSVALGLEPIATRLMALVERLHGTFFLSFDPNVRRDVIDDWPTYLGRVRRAAELADLLKVSDVDLRELDPDPGSGATPLGRAGPTVVTRGGRGTTLYRADRPPLDVPAPTVEVVDTIGAGDACMAGLLFALAEHDALRPGRLQELTDDDWAEVLRVANTAGAMTCERVAADPPTAAELRARLSA
jgi:fructokinase